MSAAAHRLALQAQGVSAALQGTPVLHGVSLGLAPGRWTAIVGPNGAGKSTLLRVLAGLLQPGAGSVQLLGRPLMQWSAGERAQRLAWLSQHGEASSELPVREVVRLGRLPHLGLFGSPGPADERIVDHAMQQTECSAWQARRMSALSGGERQRVLLARALAVQAPVLLLDEPTTHLDPPHQVALVRLLQRLAAHDGMAVASVLHDLSLALQADELVVMAAGRVQAQGPCGDAGVRAALAEVFHGAVRIERLGHGEQAQWVAVPHMHP
ncbi:ABC transporter ATP-binding protein [Ideonella sp. BN130291]|nr:ABC transporter ATP-binding protein [Ideonella sp. BN130291]